MDLATRIRKWRQFAPEQWANALNRYLPPAASAVLVVAMGYQLAKLAWTLIPGAPVDAPPPAVNPVAAVASTPAGEAVDITRIMDANLFGELSSDTVAPAAPVAVNILDAPDTSLNLLLKAAVSDTREDSGGAAIIASGTVERTYTVGDVIDGAGGAQLHAIYTDRVILSRAGQLETLRLPDEYASANRSAIAPSPLGPQAVAAPTLRTVLSDNASRLNEVVSVAAHIEQGRMVGFRLNPGEQQEQFAALGFQPGDVVTQINGTAMSDPSRGLQVFESLGESTVANVTVVRNGAPQVLTIDTSLLGDLEDVR